MLKLLAEKRLGNFHVVLCRECQGDADVSRFQAHVSQVQNIYWITLIAFVFEYKKCLRTQLNSDGRS